MWRGTVLLNRIGRRMEQRLELLAKLGVLKSWEARRVESYGLSTPTDLR